MYGTSRVMLDTKNIKGEYLNGVYNELANLLDIGDVLKIHESFRGQQVTFPVDLFSKEYIASQIVQEYNGHNVKQLATKFGYSEKWIRKILKDNPANKKEESL